MRRVGRHGQGWYSFNRLPDAARRAARAARRDPRRAGPQPRPTSSSRCRPTSTPSTPAPSRATRERGVDRLVVLASPSTSTGCARSSTSSWPTSSSRRSVDVRRTLGEPRRRRLPRPGRRRRGLRVVRAHPPAVAARREALRWHRARRCCRRHGDRHRAGRALGHDPVRRHRRRRRPRSCAGPRCSPRGDGCRRCGSPLPPRTSCCSSPSVRRRRRRPSGYSGQFAEMPAVEAPEDSPDFTWRLPIDVPTRAHRVPALVGVPTTRCARTAATTGSSAGLASAAVR